MWGNLAAFKSIFLAYVELFGQFTSEEFPDDIAELVHGHYPNEEACLLDDVLENGHAFIHPLLSCIIDGTLIYDKKIPPFSSFISLFSPSSEKGYSEQWALACGEILRVLTHYNRPVYKVDRVHNGETERSVSGNSASTSRSREKGILGHTLGQEQEKKPLRLLTPWITDILLAAPLGIRSDYFRWGPGKHPQLMPSTPRWAVANGAGVILSVCDDEVTRYETANLTAAAVPALLLPPPSTALDEHLVAGLPPLEPYARLFHRYYAIATPSATQRLLLGLLEAPPSWAPDALDAAVQLVELLRAAEDYASTMRMEEAAQANVEATAQGVASLMCAHGPEVEWRICTLWEAAYGLLPLSSSTVDLPEIVVATPLQPPVLSWNLFHPLLRVLEYLPRGSPSEASLMRIFTATVEAILQRTFPAEEAKEQTGTSRNAHAGVGPTSKNLAVAELRAMVHSLFIESCPSLDLAARLLFVVLTVCLSHDAVQQGSRKTTLDKGILSNPREKDEQTTSGRQRTNGFRENKERGAVATFDSYVLAAICALACEVQLISFTSPMVNCSQPPHALRVGEPIRINRIANGFQNAMCSAINQTRRLLGILEALLSLKPSSVGSTPGNYSSSEIVAAAMVAAHVSDLFGRSKACMHALSVIMRCKWDPDLCARALSVLALIDVNGKAVAAIADKSEPSMTHVQYSEEKDDSVDGPTSCSGERRCGQLAVNQSHEVGNLLSLETCHSHESEVASEHRKEPKFVDVFIGDSGKTIANLPMDASDVATLLTMDRHKGVNGNVGNLVKAVLAEKQDLCVAAVPLLWQNLITAPEVQMSAESTSAKQGWRQVVEALCKIVLATPAKAATAIVLQAERDLQPWVTRDDTQGQQMWRLNQRIVSLIAELLRHHNAPEAMMVLANASDLLLRATDGMWVDGEACTLPQLELLEATAVAAQLSLGWGFSGKATAEGLLNLLKCRLPATVQCLSHSSAHVRALSTSLLRDILLVETLKFRYSKENLEKSLPYEKSCCERNLTLRDWRKDVEQCLAWEAHNRRARGMSVALLASAASALGCSSTI